MIFGLGLYAFNTFFDTKAQKWAFEILNIFEASATRKKILSFFNKIWKVTYDAKIMTGNPDVDFGVVRISRVKRKEIVLENIAGVSRSPIWGKW